MTKSEVREYCSHVPLALAFERLLEVTFYKRINQYDRVLDLGAGDGVFARFAFGSRFIISIEPQLQEIRHARTMNQSWSGAQAWGANLPISSDSIDVVVSNSVLEHIDNLGPVLNEIMRVLREGGRLLVTLPTDQFERFSTFSSVLRAFRLNSLDDRFCSAYNKFWKHFHAYKPEKWQLLFQEHGFETVEAITYGSRGSCLVNDLLAPFGVLAKVRRNRGYSWVISRSFRHGWLGPLVTMISNHLDKSRHGDGLVFLELRKATPSTR